jgi:accessory colonization factor AcfC
MRYPACRKLALNILQLIHQEAVQAVNREEFLMREAMMKLKKVSTSNRGGLKAMIALGAMAVMVAGGGAAATAGAKAVPEVTLAAA